MKVCIPVQEDRGLNSVAYSHFGSAPYFLIYDTNNEEIKTIQNGDLHHAHGMCQPLKALGSEKIDAVLVGGIGRGALMKLNSQGIKVYRAADGTVTKNIELLKRRELPELSTENCCSHHGCDH